MNSLITLGFFLIVYLYVGTLIGLCFYVYYGNIVIFIAWFDKWIGFYEDKEKNILYYIYIPCIVLKFDRRNRN